MRACMGEVISWSKWEKEKYIKVMQATLNSQFLFALLKFIQFTHALDARSIDPPC